MAEEKKFRFVKTYACSTQNIPIGSIVELPSKVAKKFLDSGMIEEYKGKEIANGVYETATAKPVKEAEVREEIEEVEEK